MKRPLALLEPSEDDIERARAGCKMSSNRVRAQRSRFRKRLREIEDWDRTYAAESGVGNAVESGVGNAAESGVGNAAESGVGDRVGEQGAAHSEQDTAHIADGAPQIAECGVTEGSGIGNAAHSEQDTALIADGAPQSAEGGVTEGSGIGDHAGEQGAAGSGVEDRAGEVDGLTDDLAESVVGDFAVDGVEDRAGEVDGLTDEFAHVLNLGRNHHHRRRPYSASRRYVRISVQSTLCRSIVSCATPKHIGLR